jgi:hypothetical protein
MLGWFYKSPFTFRTKFDNRKEIEEKTALSLERGQLLHKTCLEPDLLTVMDFDKPSDRMCRRVSSIGRR